jgi:ABC-2 type transport system permease protein
MSSCLSIEGETRMLGSVWGKSLRDVQRAFSWWALGLVGLVALMISVYPSVRDNRSLNQLVNDYPDALKGFVAFGGQLDYVSGAGYLGSELFSLMIPLLLLVAAIGAGSRAIAGEEEAGTLDLLLANPISRRRVALEKLAALFVEVAALGVVLFVALVVGAHAVTLETSAGHLAAATASAVMLAVSFGVIAMLLGAATGRRARASGITAALAVAAYVLNGLAPLVEALKPFRRVSLFYHYAASDPLRHGLDLSHATVLIVVGVVAAALVPIVFDRRDLES